MKWADGKMRCYWANPKNERYICYHDEEWGVPVHDDQKLLEMLILECFQAVAYNLRIIPQHFQLVLMISTDLLQVKTIKGFTKCIPLI